MPDIPLPWSPDALIFAVWFSMGERKGGFWQGHEYLRHQAPQSSRSFSPSGFENSAGLQTVNSVAVPGSPERELCHGKCALTQLKENSSVFRCVSHIRLFAELHSHSLRDLSSLVTDSHYVLLTLFRMVFFWVEGDSLPWTHILKHLIILRIIHFTNYHTLLYMLDTMQKRENSFSIYSIQQKWVHPFAI